ncbi:MAG TPA: hypothetical protein VMN36_11360 [Verrucomicrobiales bacterium]|nr:hypothetical protein [Verrucomicrobiales bacterium]
MPAGGDARATVNVEDIGDPGQTVEDGSDGAGDHVGRPDDLQALDERRQFIWCMHGGGIVQGRRGAPPGVGAGSGFSLGNAPGERGCGCRLRLAGAGRNR